MTPADKLAGLEEVIFAERDRKLEALGQPTRRQVTCRRQSLTQTALA